MSEIFYHPEHSENKNNIFYYNFKRYLFIYEDKECRPYFPSHRSNIDFLYSSYIFYA